MGVTPKTPRAFPKGDKCRIHSTRGSCFEFLVCIALVCELLGWDWGRILGGCPLVDTSSRSLWLPAEKSVRLGMISCTPVVGSL
eukprot:3836708-Amphidinium_carterae.1